MTCKLDTIVQNVVSPTIGQPGFVHPDYVYVFLSYFNNSKSPEFCREIQKLTRENETSADTLRLYIFDNGFLM